MSKTLQRPKRRASPERKALLAAQPQKRQGAGQLTDPSKPDSKAPKSWKTGGSRAIPPVEGSNAPFTAREVLAPASISIPKGDSPGSLGPRLDEFKRLFPAGGGDTQNVAQVVAAVANLKNGFDFSPWSTVVHAFEVPLSADAARTALKEVHGAIEDYKKHSQYPADFEFSKRLETTLNQLLEEAKIALTSGITQSTQFEPVTLVGQRRASSSTGTSDARSIHHVLPNFPIEPSLPAMQTIAIEHSPGALFAHYEGGRVELQPSLPMNGGDRVEWVGYVRSSGASSLSPVSSNVTELVLRLRLNPGMSKVEGGTITQRLHVSSRDGLTTHENVFTAM